MKAILSDLIDEYIELHKETLDLPARPGWAAAIEQGKAEVDAGVPGKGLDELED